MGKLTKRGSWAFGTRVISLGALCATSLVASVAFACGGFFCGTQPVEQTGEEILFAVQDDGMIEAHVRVEYEGPSDQFAWIVPTPSLPEVGLSSELLFSVMRRSFSPRFELDWDQVGQCRSVSTSGGRGGGGGGSMDSGVDVSSEPTVEVVLQDAVGPYDFVVLQATDTTELFEWLNTNGYLIPDDVAPFVEPYVMMGNDTHFVAFRLTKTADAGDIQPITLRYEADRPMVPIQLTAVAASPDLGIAVNVLGNERAVPENYLHVHINEARIDWFNQGSNYDALVTEAMNEAGGQGFTTQYAGSTGAMDRALYVPGQYRTDVLTEIASRSEFVRELQRQGFASNSQLLSMMQQYMPMPEAVVADGVNPRSYYSCIGCFGDNEDEPFDAAGFAAAIQERIVEPLMHAQDLFYESPYFTRLYTTLSPDEMTLDPAFTFNRSMDRVSNVHRATAVIDCTNGGSSSTRPVLLTLADGRSWIVPASERFGGPMFADMPAADWYEETASVGPPQVVSDNARRIDGRLAEADVANPIAEFGTGSTSSGCSVGPRTTSTPFALLAGLGLFAVRRRRG